MFFFYLLKQVNQIPTIFPLRLFYKRFDTSPFYGHVV